ncbi:hypothetical protein ERJ75_001200300 [Trypanosoma vivax]|uniref:Uncharacterized protein n=1 Tax=Trypanosoma vivax (strain Y486) TaxID=1055687 RepID=F9WTT3_TRYVY|nr:hypothetical protein ERJ75_001200300 [Trypanosoma vivax]CCD20979.1 hypothetical protein TvY486_0038710 [Trypanosoma vivax Y486]|eukprot:CCD20979.1 hypothetical protein TvY486_0038710 [Trypanosoma vivax Y486]
MRLQFVWSLFLAASLCRTMAALPYRVGIMESSGWCDLLDVRVVAWCDLRKHILAIPSALQAMCAETRVMERKFRKNVPAIQSQLRKSLAEVQSKANAFSGDGEVSNIWAYAADAFLQQLHALESAKEVVEEFSAKKEELISPLTAGSGGSIIDKALETMDYILPRLCRGVPAQSGAVPGYCMGREGFREVMCVPGATGRINSTAVRTALSTFSFEVAHNNACGLSNSSAKNCSCLFGGAIKTAPGQSGYTIPDDSADIERDVNGVVETLAELEASYAAARTALRDTEEIQHSANMIKGIAMIKALSVQLEKINLTATWRIAEFEESTNSAGTKRTNFMPWLGALVASVFLRL